MRALLIAAGLAAGAAPALAEPVAYECTIRRIVGDDGASEARPGNNRQSFAIDEARGIGCIMSAGICNPLYSRLSVSRSSSVVVGVGSMLIGDNTVAVLFHPGVGRATITYTFVSMNPASQGTHISGPKDCHKLDVTPNLDATF